jgi:NAD+ synthase (glutamine-hydrolysing)
MKLKVGAASLNQTPIDWDNNTQNIISVLEEARNQNVQVLCLPEMCITGYGCEDYFLSKSVQDTAITKLKELLPYTNKLFTCFGIPLEFRNALYNVIAVVFDGKILGFVPKQHLAGDGIHYEQRWFKPWPSNVVKEFCINIDGEKEIFPIGDLIFTFNTNINIGFEICEDAFVANRPGAALAQRGVDIVLNPSASHFAFGKRLIRERLVVESSRAFNSTYIYANLLGNESGRVIYSGDCLIATGGELVGEGSLLSMSKTHLTTAVVDVSKTKVKATSSASFTANIDNDNFVDHNLLLKSTYETISKSYTKTQYTKYYIAAEFTDATTLGLWDYLIKSKSKGYVISLSGGADSAACAVLVRLMLDRVCTQFGCKYIADQFGLTLPDKEPLEFIASKLITCVYQSTENSSETTLTAAEMVAMDIGATFHEINVNNIVNEYVTLASKMIGRPLTWDTDDVTLQNIQARVRAPSVWMIANIENKLLITTSNRSESAVGYCTMDGDTAGSIAPIGGVDKAFIIQWLRLYSSAKFTSLKLILKQKPTAELRPGETQTDEEDLMPYETLNLIEQLAIRDKKNPKEVIEELRDSGIERATAIKYVIKFFTLFSKNQWKRERYAPSFYVDDHSLDPKTWCRFPILSGGFKQDLEIYNKERKQ